MLTIPEDGLDNRTFESLRGDQGTNIVLVWREPLSESQSDAALDVVQGWMDDADLWAGCDVPGKRHAFMHQTSLNSAGLFFTLVNVSRPREPLQALLERLAGAGIAMREQLFGVVEWPEGGYEETSVDPSAPPVADGLDSIEAYWDACFDHGGPQPKSEIHNEVHESPPEMRFTRLHLEGVRICYATPTPNFLPANARSTRVSEVVQGAVAQLFAPLRAPRMRDDPEPEAPVPPRLMDRDGNLTGTVERIFRNGRVGYSLALLADSLFVGYPRELGGGWAFRFREYEVFVALRAAIRELELEPVVMWKRFRRPDGATGHLEFQLWEKLDAEASREGRDEVRALRREAALEGVLRVVPLEQPPPRPSPHLEPASAEGLPHGAAVLRGGATRRLALAPSGDGDELWVLDSTQAKKLEVPASTFYRGSGRAAYSPDGDRCVVATKCMTRVVDLAQGKARELLQGFGYEEVRCLAGGLAVVRGSVGQQLLDPTDPDVAALYRHHQRPLPAAPEPVDAPPALYLVDLDPDCEAPLLQTISCRASQVTPVAGGRVVIIWTLYEPWRTAVLVLCDRRLHLAAKMREALPDVQEVDGRVVSSNAVELVGTANLADADSGDFLDLAEIAP